MIVLTLLQYSIVVVIICVLNILSSTHAFFPADWLSYYIGISATSHATMTRMAFETLSAHYFPNLNLTSSMIAARDTIIDANALVDKDQFHSAKHFDSENFDSGQETLVMEKVRIGNALRDGR
jgi:hypothetical protein